MNSKIKLLVASLTILSFGSMFAEMSETDFSDAVMTLATKKRVKHFDCLRVKNLRVCENEVIDGNLTVAGSVSVAASETVGGNLIVTGTLVAGDIISTGSLCAPYIFLCPAPALGTPGAPGVGGDLAYGAIASIITQTIANGAPVSFGTNAPISSGVIENPGNITVINAGIYRIQAEVLGSAEFGGPSQLVFSLHVNGAPAIAAFSSSISASVGTPVLVAGFGLLPLAAGAVLTLVNTGTPAVLQAGVATDSSPIANAVLMVERIAA